MRPASPVPYRQCRTLARVVMLLATIPSAVAVAGPAATPASPVRLGLHAGASLPVAQEDASIGVIYGLSGRVLLGGRFAAGASFDIVGHGNGSTTVGGREIDLETPDLRGFAINADVLFLRTGTLDLYATLGLGGTRVTPARGERQSHTTTNLGGGALLRLGAVPLWLEVSPRFFVVRIEDASRKHVALRAGLIYAIE